MTRDAFPLPSFGDKLRELAAQVSHGRGFQILRGVPVERCAWVLGPVVHPIWCI